MGKAFDRIAEGLADALAFAEGDGGKAKLHVPPEIDVKAIRAKTGLSQDSFASMFGFTVHQIRQWEQGRHRPVGALRAYLLIIDQAPKEVTEMLRGLRETERRDRKHAA